MRGTYDLLGKVDTRDGIGAPLCLCCVEADEEECVVVGDDNGNVGLLLEDLDRAPNGRRLTGSSAADTTHEFEILHEHSDWVTQVCSDSYCDKKLSRRLGTRCSGDRPRFVVA